MRSVIVILVFLLQTANCFCQQEELVYTYNKDSTLVGVSTSAGKLVIPVAYRLIGESDGEPIGTREIALFDTNKSSMENRLFAGVSVFDRKGHFLYHPFWYDNGPDYFREGLRRYVDHGKVGFADLWGKIIIPAKYAMTSDFFLGHAIACLDCKYVNPTGEEHGTDWTGSKFILINRKGKQVYPHFLKQPVRHLNKEMLQSLVKEQPLSAPEQKLIAQIKQTQAYRLLENKEDELEPVIVERPQDGHGVYIIEFEAARGSALYYQNLSFVISPDGQHIYMADDYVNAVVRGFVPKETR